jgi:hypothetical protein
MAGDNRCSVSRVGSLGDASDPCSLSGWLYWPAYEPGVTKLPAIVYNHEHDVAVNEPCAVADYFTRRGFVVFAPLRRGHRDAGNAFRNTGQFIDDYVAGQPPANVILPPGVTVPDAKNGAEAFCRVIQSPRV